MGEAVTRTEGATESRARAALGSAAFVLMILVTAAALASVPWSESVLEPCHLAFLATALTVLVYTWQRFWGTRVGPWERGITAAFLAGMPLVYLGRYLLHRPAAGGPWLELELLGLAAYGGCAWLGLARSPWFLVVGIAAHGLAWDVWHFHRSAYVPDWYSIGCLALDVAISFYVATRIPRWGGKGP